MPIFSFLHSQWKVCVRLSSFRLHLRFPSASATFRSTGWTCPCSESECSFSTQFQSCPATAERRSHVRHGDTFKKVLTCPADTHLEEMLKGYSFVEFIRLLWGGGMLHRFPQRTNIRVTSSSTMWPIEMLATSNMAASAMLLAVSFPRAPLRDSSSSTTCTEKFPTLSC